jgi:hypothetical protein
MYAENLRFWADMPLKMRTCLNMLFSHLLSSLLLLLLLLLLLQKCIYRKFIKKNSIQNKTSSVLLRLYKQVCTSSGSDVKHYVRMCSGISGGPVFKHSIMWPHSEVIIVQVPERPCKIAVCRVLAVRRDGF